MPYTDKFALIQNRYTESIAIVMWRLLNEGGWERVADEFDVTEETVGRWMRRCEIHRECVYLLPGQTISIADTEQREERSA